MATKGTHGTKKGATSAMPLGTYHLVDPGFIHLADPVDEDRAVVQEALYRGADLGDLWKLLLLRKNTARRSTSAGLGSGLGLNYSFALQEELAPATDSEFRMVQHECDAYRRLMKSEFASLPRPVQKAFASHEDKKESEEDWLSRCFQQYLKLRAAYYVAGYDTPVEAFLSKVQPAQCLGEKVDNGLHEVFSQRLNDLGNKLDHMCSGLAHQIGPKLSSIGFQPRYIAPKQGQALSRPSLSNHAFGLAIDFNASWNPHIKDQDVIATLKEATGYDFGAVFAPMCAPDLVLVEESYRNAMRASDALKRWMTQWLPIYVGIVSQEKHHRKKLAAHAGKGGKPKDPSADLVGVSVEPSCREPDPEMETNILRLTTINKYHDIHEMQRWAHHGVLSLPLALVMAMKELKFGWGGEWGCSKDFMHFELDHKKVVPPESVPRPLEDLLPQNPGSHFLLASALKQRQAKKHKP